MSNGRQLETNKGSGVSFTASNSVEVGQHESEMLSNMLAAAPKLRKQILGERLYVEDLNLIAMENIIER